MMMMRMNDIDGLLSRSINAAQLQSYQPDHLLYNY